MTPNRRVTWQATSLRLGFHGARLAELRPAAALFRPFCSFGFEFQEPCSAFTSWRARKRDSKTFSLAAHNQELVLGHVTFVLQQLFQISLERGLGFNHCIKRLFDLGGQIICIDVLPLQFFLCHRCNPSALAVGFLERLPSYSSDSGSLTKGGSSSPSS